jgi:DNA-binding PadR family transcriptional regulator
VKPDHRRLTPAEFEVLLALADGDKHGYAILKSIAREGSGVALGPATLYTIVRRFLDGGLIVETAQRPDPALDDERRRYYRLTKLGRRVAMAEARRLERLLSDARATGLLPKAGLPKEG